MVTILDGGTGQELVRRGVTVGPLWSARAVLDDPQVVVDVHADYLAAGADVITTHTYAINRYRLARAVLAAADAAGKLAWLSWYVPAVRQRLHGDPRGGA